MNRAILAACLWAFLILVAMIGLQDDPKEVVCIAAQSISITGEHIIEAVECVEVTP